jgi:hypothetical protein
MQYGRRALCRTPSRRQKPCRARPLAAVTTRLGHLGRRGYKASPGSLYSET